MKELMPSKGKKEDKTLKDKLAALQDSVNNRFISFLMRFSKDKSFLKSRIFEQQKDIQLKTCPEFVIDVEKLSKKESEEEVKIPSDLGPMIENAKNTTPVTLVLVPLGIPGLGKSTIVNQVIPVLQQCGFKVSKVESDQI